MTVSDRAVPVVSLFVAVVVHRARPDYCPPRALPTDGLGYHDDGDYDISARDDDLRDDKATPAVTHKVGQNARHKDAVKKARRRQRAAAEDGAGAGEGRTVTMWDFVNKGSAPAAGGAPGPASKGAAPKAKGAANKAGDALAHDLDAMPDDLDDAPASGGRGRKDTGRRGAGSRRRGASRRSPRDGKRQRASESRRSSSRGEPPRTPATGDDGADFGGHETVDFGGTAEASAQWPQATHEEACARRGACGGGDSATTAARLAKGLEEYLEKQ